MYFSTFHFCPQWIFIHHSCVMNFWLHLYDLYLYVYMKGVLRKQDEYKFALNCKIEINIVNKYLLDKLLFDFEQTMNMQSLHKHLSVICGTNVVLTLSLMISIIPILILTLCIKGHILYRANIVWKVDLLRSEYNLTMESNNVISQGYCMHIWCSAIRHYLAWIHLHIRTIEQEELNINYFLYMMQFYIFSNCKKWAS